jgi:TPR repeat protein
MKYLTLFILLIIAQSISANQCTTLVKQQDYYEAAELCLKLANKGDKAAQFSMAVLYYAGNGVMSDMAKAQEWMRKAALQNHSQAQYNLGIMLANGQGSDADLIEAYAWLKTASENGYTAAKDSLQQLESELSSSEKKAAEKQVAKLKTEIKI